MNMIFLMDPLDTVVFEKDTSYILMRGAHRAGHTVYYLKPGNISLVNGDVHMVVEEIIPNASPDPLFERRGSQTLTGAEIDVVFIRTDPPFDVDYLTHTWLLDRLPPSSRVINSPHGIFTVNEKLWATQFTDLIPRTVVTRSRDIFTSFLKEEQQVVLKPTDGFGGQGIFQVKADDTNANVMFESVTANSTRDAIIQQWIPEAQQGDKRILLLAGEPLGAVLRVHGDQDHRNNFFAGGHPEPAEITERDKHVIAQLKPHLLELGLHFVGIDIIGEHLIEVNVTSPTCLQEMNRLYSQSLEDDVIRFVETLKTT